MAAPHAVPSWRLGHGRSLALDRARLMAILNVTPDSFSDGGESFGVEPALARARQAIAEGADMLDVGGESTRPGAALVSAAEQIKRVVPVIRAIRDAGIDVPISVDTTRAAVAAEAIRAGADAVNDVSAGEGDPDMLSAVAENTSAVVLMHRLRPPPEDEFSHKLKHAPDYGEQGVARCVCDYLERRVAAAVDAGIDRAKIAIDPGLGFGKSVRQNFELIHHTRNFTVMGVPVVVGASRKSFLGAVTGCETPSDRVSASVAAAVVQRMGGAAIFRVHDVEAHRQGLAVADEALLADS